MDAHLPPDLLPLDLAFLAGAASQRAGFSVRANPYAGETAREARLHAWAFDLGWRATAILELAVKERRQLA